MAGEQDRDHLGLREEVGAVRHEVAELRSELREGLAELRREMAEMERRMVIAMALIVSAVVGTAAALNALF